MNDKCKYCDYVSKCSRICEYNSYLCKVHRSFPKVVDKSYEQLQQENKKLNGTIQTYDILLKANVEENKQLKGTTHCFDEEEHRVLKKQLEEYKRLGFKHLNDKCNKLENQQKVFIEYLEDLIKQNETVVEVSKYGLPKNCSKLLIDFYKEILSKYREIIGDDK